MKLREYEQNLKTPLRQATLVFLLRDDEILLAVKKRDFGKGKWNGAGGKLDSGEDIITAAIREAEEEIGVTPLEPKEVARLKFYFPAPLEKDWSQEVFVFTATKWNGIPTETEEMKPKWFKVKKIPYTKMWEDDIVWLPKVLAGFLIKGSFMFEGEKMIEYFIEEVKSLTD